MSAFVFDFVDTNTVFLNSFSDPENFATTFTVSDDLFKSFIQFSEENDIPINKDEISRSKPLIAKRLTTAIARQKWNDLGFFTVLNHTDPSVLKGLERLGTE